MNIKINEFKKTHKFASTFPNVYEFYLKKK